MNEAPAKKKRTLSPYLPSVALLTLSVILAGTWNFGGFLWRSFFGQAATRIEMTFGNETGGHLEILSIRVGDEIHAIHFDLLARRDVGSIIFDFDQNRYIEPIEVLYLRQDITSPQRLSFTSDARRFGSCSYTITFGETGTVSGCVEISDSDEAD